MTQRAGLGLLTGSLNTARAIHMATLLPNWDGGSVAGGVDGDRARLRTTRRAGPDAPQGRQRPRAAHGTLLPGRVCSG